MRWTGLISNFPGTSAGRLSIDACCFSLKVSFVCFFRGKGLGNIYWWWKSLLANIQRRSWKNSFASHVYLFKRWHAHCSLIFFNIFVNVFSFGAFLSQTLGLVFVQNLLFLESMHFAKKKQFSFAMSPEFMEDNGQTVQTIMDKTFVCLCAQWHAWARGRGQLKIQTVFVLNYLCKSCEHWCLQYVTLVHNHSNVYRA